MTTETRHRDPHNNTDVSNAFCYCSIGENHGNLSAEHRQIILRSMLRGQDVEITSDGHGTKVRKTATTPNGWVTAARRLLRSFGIDSQMEYPPESSAYVGGWLFVPAETFNR